MLLFGNLCTAFETELDGLDVAAMDGGMERDIAFGVVEGDHLFAGTAAGFAPLEEHFERLGGGVLSGLVNGVVTVVAGLARARVKLGDLKN